MFPLIPPNEGLFPKSEPAVDPPSPEVAAVPVDEPPKANPEAGLAVVPEFVVDEPPKAKPDAGLAVAEELFRENPPAKPLLALFVPVAALDVELEPKPPVFEAVFEALPNPNEVGAEDAAVFAGDENEKLEDLFKAEAAPPVVPEPLPNEKLPPGGFDPNIAMLLNKKIGLFKIGPNA